MNKYLLEVEDLNISFKIDNLPLPVKVVTDLSFHLKQGEMLGVVGESGSGKSITNLALLGLLKDNAIVTAKKLNFDQSNLLNLNEKQWQAFRGGEISMIFQDPMSALNPYLTVEFQLVETILAHLNLSKSEAINKALELLSLVGISSPKERLKSYPFELSGGMAQRVMIAQAISSNPKLLIADEPTTALDVTIQKQILTLIKSLQEKNNMAVILVTHDLGVVSEYSDRIQVMYAGEIVETNFSQDLILRPQHPYTFGLLNSRPGEVNIPPKTPLLSMPGMMPSLLKKPTGCQFHPRCNQAKIDCTKIDFISSKENVRCLYPLNLTPGHL